MKNNQFKKEIRTLIEQECKLFDFKSLYVDTSANTRMIYIFTLDYRFAGIFRVWLNNETVHICFGIDPYKSLLVKSNCNHEADVKYGDFDRVVSVITEAFKMMDKEVK